MKLSKLLSKIEQYMKAQRYIELKKFCKRKSLTFSALEWVNLFLELKFVSKTQCVSMTGFHSPKPMSF